MTDLKTVWKTQEVEVSDMSTLSEVRARAGRFEGGIRWRNAVLYAFSVLSIITPIWLVAAGRFPELRIPLLATIPVHLSILWQIKRRIAARPLPGNACSSSWHLLP